MTCRAHLVRRSSRPYDAEKDGRSRVSRSSSTAWRRESRVLSKISGESIRLVSFKLLFAIKRVVSRSPLAPRKHLRENGWPSLAETSGLAPNEPRRNDGVSEARTRDARKVRAGHHHDDPSTDVDRHLPDCLHAVTRASRSITPRVADPSPSSRGRRAKHRKAATRDRPSSTMFSIDNFTVKSPNVTYTDEHIESTYTCVRRPECFPARRLAARVPLSLRPRARLRSRLSPRFCRPRLCLGPTMLQMQAHTDWSVVRRIIPRAGTTTRTR